MMQILLFLPFLFMMGDISPFYQDSVRVVLSGETVTWTNNHEFAHTISSGTIHAPDGLFESSLIMQGDSFSHRFDHAGSFPYFCMLHPWETGQVDVMGGISEQSNSLKLENERLRERVAQLEAQVADLKAIIIEQLNVIYEWVISR